MNIKTIFGLALLVAITACGDSSKRASSSDSEDQLAELKDTARIHWEYMDTSVKPEENFFRFCNGKWVDETEIPEEEKRWTSFNVLQEKNEKKLKALLEEMSEPGDQPKYKELVGKFYVAMMDSIKRNDLGLKPIQFILDEIEASDSPADLTAFLARNGVGRAFSFSIRQDLVKNDQYSAYISQSGLGLPNKTYYFDDQKKDIREKYKKFIADMLMHAGESEEQASANMEVIYGIEEELADASMSPVELRNPQTQYNPRATSEFIEAYPNFDWNGFFKGIGVESFDTVVVSQPGFVERFNEIVNERPAEDWKAYYKWRTLNSHASQLDDTTAMMAFDFYQTTLSGVEKRKPGWKRAINQLTRNELGEALGRAFVDVYFSEEGKEKVNLLVDHLELAFRERLEKLEWMSDSTKQMALKKLESFGRKLGYPDEWEEYDGLEVSSDDHLANVIAVHQFSLDKNLEKLGEPIDDDEWGMPPHMVNAYYHPLKNEIAFPAGIMQPPFFDANATDAVNYGRIGMVIGHEFTHGFDDMGSQFDAEGSMKNWWSQQDRDKFEARAAKLGHTFSQFCPFDSVCVQPDLTMGENIADLGGLILAYNAYQKTEEYKSGKKLNGYNPSQQFFIAFGQLWRYKIRNEALKEQIATDPHSPGMYRVNGPLLNMPDFFEAFNIQESDSMRIADEEVARIW